MPCSHLSNLTNRYDVECPARLLQHALNIPVPLPMMWELCGLVGDAARDVNWIPSHEAIWSLFFNEYLAGEDFYKYLTHELREGASSDAMQLLLKVRYRGQGMVLRGEGPNLLPAIIDALGWDFSALPCQVRSERTAVLARTAVFAEVSIPARYTLFGIGLSENRTAATIMAILSAFNRALRKGAMDDSMKTASIEA
jgi:hypothetical protein